MSSIRPSQIRIVRARHASCGLTKFWDVAPEEVFFWHEEETVAVELHYDRRVGDGVLLPVGNGLFGWESHEEVIAVARFTEKRFSELRLEEVRFLDPERLASGGENLEEDLSPEHLDAYIHQAQLAAWSKRQSWYLP